MDRARYVRPSAAATWTKCAGYAALNASLDNTPIDEAGSHEVREDGTACHWLAAELWEGRRPEVGTFSPNNRELTQEMLDAAEGYVEHLKALPYPMDVEKLLPVSAFIPGCSDGTPDAIGWCQAEQMVDVHDLKYGFRPVEVFENLQLLIYAGTKAWQLMTQGFQVRKLRLTIHQPRCPHPDGPVRSWEHPWDDVQGLFQFIRERALAVYAPDPPCAAGPWCGDCEGSRACRTLQAAAGRSMEVSYGATPFVLTPHELALELSHLLEAQKHIESRITGLQTQAEHEIRNGRLVPGFALEPGATKRRWMDGTADRVQKICKLFGVDPHEPTKLRSPAKLSKLLPGDALAPYIVKPQGERRLKMLDKNYARKRLR